MRPGTRQEFINYGLRKLGAPVIEINVAPEQIDDLVDDCIQIWQEYTYNGYERTLLKHQLNANESANAQANHLSGVGIEARSFDAGDATVVDITNSTVFIPDHGYNTGQQLTIDSLTNTPIGIASTTITGIGTTTLLTGTVYAIAIDANKLQFSNTWNQITRPSDSGPVVAGNPGPPLTFTSLGEGLNESQIKANFFETSNWITLPDHIVGVNNVFKYGSNNIMGSGMWNFKYQLYLNDLAWFTSYAIVSYDIARQYLEMLDFLLNTDTQIRFNMRSGRLYLDIDWTLIYQNEFIIIDCYRALDPHEFNKIWNDVFMKQYFVAILKKQWGQNLIKFQGLKLPGGVELNGRQIYEDGERERQALIDRMAQDWALPPLDLIA